MFLNKCIAIPVISFFSFFTTAAQNFPAVFDPGFLNGKNGFTIKGLNPGDRLSCELNLIGDLNHDGLADMAMYASTVGPKGEPLMGTTYIIFGSKKTFPASFDLTTLNGTNGFKFEGIGEDERRGKSIGQLGDVNGDGIDDIALGTELNKQVILFGKNGTFAASMTIDMINGSNGFIIDLPYVNEIKGAGDFNGDGVKDILMAKPFFAGQTYILFGRKTAFPATVTETWFDGTKGFILDKVDGSTSAYLADGIGDINNDGYDDVAVGIWLDNNSTIQKTYVYFGRPGTFDPLVNLKAVNGTDGFAINNYYAKDNVTFLTWVGPLGDINGDGMDDFFSHKNVIYGSKTFPAIVDVVTPASGLKGFAVNKIHNSCAPAGDLNLDGIDDFIIMSDQDEDFVVYGSAAGFPAALDPTALDSTKGFKVTNLVQSNIGRQTDGGADINGDGLSDFILGSEGIYTGANGIAYIIFGGDHYAMPLNTGYPKAFDMTASGFTFQLNAREKGNIHYVLHDDSYMRNVFPSHDQILNAPEDTPHGTFNIDQASVNINKTISGLNPETTYDVYFFLEDEAGSISYVYKLSTIKTLADTKAPVITGCPVNPTMPCGGLPDYLQILQIKDDADPSPAVTQEPGPGATIYSGLTVTITAWDYYQNINSCTFTISVSNTIDCPGDQTLDPGSALPDYTANASYTGFCAFAPVISQTPEPGTPVTDNITVTLTAVNDVLTATCSFMVNGTITASAGSKMNGDLKATVYPSPATDVVFVKNCAYSSYEVLDDLGRSILQGGSKDEINISNLDSGMYMILFYNSDRQIIAREKIVKK